MKRLAPLLFTVIVACARAPLTPELPRPAWPPPPGRAMVRYLGAFPDVATRREAPPPWRRALELVFGIDEGPRRQGPLLARPFGIAAAGNQLLIADPDARRVLRVTWQTGQWEAVDCIDRAWVMPMAVALAPDGSVWVADGGAGALVHVSGARCEVVGQGLLERPTGVAVTADRVYTVDPPRHAVVAFAADGREVLRVGGRGDASGQFNFPTAIALDGEGKLLVVDALNFRVSRMALDGRSVGSFGEPGDGSGAFGRPKAIAVDGLGRIYVSDTQNDVVVIFDAAGRFLVAAGGAGSLPGSLSSPAGVAVSTKYLFVADSQDHRVQIYELLEAEP